MLQSYIVALLQKQLSFIYSILLANPLYRHGWQELCPWCNTPLAQLFTLLLEPALEGAVTNSGGSRYLTFQVTFHRSFPPCYYYDVKLQKKHEMCKKIHYKLWAIMDKDRQ